MKLSVIVPVYNRERLIISALRSLLRQSGDADLDIIVIDDGSTDDSAAAVRGLIEQAPCIRLFTQPNQGVTRARNAGLRELLPQTRLVSFLDSDDISPTGRFRADLAHFTADPSLELVYSWMRLADRIDNETLEPAEGCDTRAYRGIQLAAGIYRRELVETLGGFDEDFVQAEDTDFLFRLFERKPRVALPDTIGVYYRQHANSLMGDRDEARREFLRACHKSMLRRRRDPSLGRLHDLIKVDERGYGRVA